mmetsp:Transcript_46024/g.141970  ORF Transcript_46024/g.141970 Transcript_46024/m.141970 type:complete len:220 (-) Transcript_46024:1577-2236(-)
MPRLPVRRLAVRGARRHGRVHLLRAVHVDGARAVDLAELALEVGVAKAEGGSLAAGQRADGSLVDVARLSDAKVFRRLCDVELVDARSLLERDGAGGAVVDGHRVAREAVRLFELSVEKVELVHRLDGAAVKCLLEEVAAALELCAAEARGELREVAQPEGERVRVLEEGDALLVRLEGELEVLVLLEEGGVVEDQLRRHDPQLDHLVVRHARRLEPGE